MSGLTGLDRDGWGDYKRYKKVLVVHGYGKNRDGWLGLNELVCKKAAELWKTGEYGYLLLPAGVNEDTGGDDERLIADDHLDYLFCNYWRDFPPDTLKKIVLWSPECATPIASDTMTECLVAYRMLGRLRNEFGTEDFFEIHPVGVFPHSLKIQRCWNLFLRKGMNCIFPRYGTVEIRFGAMHHVAPWLDMRSETVRQFIMNVVSAAVGVFDPFGKHWPAKQVKQHRRDLYTPAHLRHRVIF